MFDYRALLEIQLSVDFLRVVQFQLHVQLISQFDCCLEFKGIKRKEIPSRKKDIFRSLDKLSDIRSLAIIDQSQR